MTNGNPAAATGSANASYTDFFANRIWSGAISLHSLMMAAARATIIFTRIGWGLRAMGSRMESMT